MFKTKNLLLQPYPFNDTSIENPGRAIGLAFAQGGFVALFLIIFQPFNINRWSDPNKIWYLIVFGLITTSCLLFIKFGIVRLFPKFFNETDWTVGREIISVVLVLFLIALGNYLYAALTFMGGFSFQNFISSLITVVLIGIFPIAFGVFSNYIIQLKKYQKPVTVRHVNDQQTDQKPVTTMLTLVAENEKDSIKILPEDLLYIESADNYSVVHFRKENRLEKEMLRSSLTRLEKQIDSATIVRCHRSFIVNLSKVNDVTGNAQGYKFHLQPTEIVIPVARKYSDLVDRISN